MKPEWLAACDFIYSSSWDHSYKPKKMFLSWMSCIRPGGVIILTHTSAHNVISEADPFGMDFEELCAYLDRLGGGKWEVSVPEGAPDVATTFGKSGQSIACRHIFFCRLR